MGAPIFSLRPGQGSEAGVALLLLAHQDDEIAFAPLIALLRKHRRRVRVVYLTDGGAGRATPAVRSCETMRALAALGVPAADIRFLGSDSSIPDGRLYRHFTRAYDALEEECRTIHDCGDVFTLAWEGGHPDHDAVHVLAMAVARGREWGDRMWQVPFYRAADRGPRLFSMFAPLACNGPVRELPAARSDALLRARMLRFYPSQWLALTRLAPAVCWHALLGTPVKVQGLDVQRSLERPTLCPLLYERRNGISFAEFAENANRFLQESAAVIANRSLQEPLPAGTSGYDGESS